jgi:hypothetical protein
MSLIVHALDYFSYCCATFSAYSVVVVVVVIVVVVAVDDDDDDWD